MIHVVMASSGEYSDRTEWAVCAFTEAWKAERFVSLLETELRKLESAGYEFYGYSSNWDLREALADQMKVFDPGFRIVDDLPTYWVEPIELLDGIPVVSLDMKKLLQDAADRANFRTNCDWGTCASCGARGHAADPKIVEVGKPGDSERYQWLCAKCREAREAPKPPLICYKCGVNEAVTTAAKIDGELTAICDDCFDMRWDMQDVECSDCGEPLRVVATSPYSDMNPPHYCFKCWNKRGRP